MPETWSPCSLGFPDRDNCPDCTPPTEERCPDVWSYTCRVIGDHEVHTNGAGVFWLSPPN